MEKLCVRYLGHSCFELEHKGQRIVLDPYEDGSVPGLGKLRVEAEFVYCSHQHGDHNFAAGVTLTGGQKPNFALETLDTDHDDAGGAKRGKNTVHIFDFDGVRAAHLGDLGRLPTEKEYEKLAGVDLLLIPVGGFFTIDASAAKKIIDRAQPRVAVPMHYRNGEIGFDVIADIADVLPVLGKYEKAGSQLELDSEKRGIILMTPANAI